MTVPDRLESQAQLTQHTDLLSTKEILSKSRDAASRDICHQEGWSPAPSQPLRLARVHQAMTAQELSPRPIRYRMRFQNALLNTKQKSP